MDVIMADKMDQALLKAAVALLKRCEPQLLQMSDMEDALHLLKLELPGVCVCPGAGASGHACASDPMPPYWATVGRTVSWLPTPVAQDYQGATGTHGGLLKLPGSGAVSLNTL